MSTEKSKVERGIEEARVPKLPPGVAEIVGSVPEGCELGLFHSARPEVQSKPWRAELRGGGEGEVVSGWSESAVKALSDLAVGMEKAGVTG